jgi:hypothetical protein
MGNQQEVGRNLELAWLAGMLNGDGCFSLTIVTRKEHIKCELSLTLTQCDPCLIEKTTSILEWLGVNPAIAEYPPTGAGRSTKYNLRINRMAGIAKVIDAILPYMAGAKAAQAKLMRRYISHRIEYSDHSKRRDAHFLNDTVAIGIAKQFYDLRGSKWPLPESSTTIPQGSTGKRPEVHGAH